MNNIINHIYTLQEIGMVLNLSQEEITTINYYSKKNKLDEIIIKIPVLKKFKPFIISTKIENKNYYAVAAKVFDTYLDTGLLPEINREYRQPDIEKKEYWEYNPSYFYELNTKENWEFALNYFKQKDPKIELDDIWGIFLAGCSRMNYYQNTDTDIDKRIKFAIMEYMVRRPQFFTTDDFVDNPLLHNKDNIQNS